MTDFQCFYIAFTFKCNLFIFQVDVNFDDVLDAWFGKSEASIDNIDIDAFLINAMFPVDFNVEETPIHFIQTKEEELEDIFKEDMQPDIFPLSCKMVSISDDIFSCIGCGSLFFSKENLDNHKENCDKKVKKESSRHCCKKFSRCSNKYLHERGCQENKQRRKSSLKQNNN